MRTLLTRGWEGGEEKSWISQQEDFATRVDDPFLYHTSLNPENRDYKFLRSLEKSSAGQNSSEGPDSCCAAREYFIWLSP